MLLYYLFCKQSDLEEIDLENGGEDELDDESKEELTKYYKETDALSKAINRIHENVETIESRYKISLSEHVQDSDKAIAANDIACLLDRTEKTSEAVRKRLRRIAGENKIFRGEHPEKTGTLRMRVNTHQSLTRRFMDAMQLFEESQESHRDNVREAVERQMRLMNPQATEEEIQDALRNGNVNEMVDNSPTFAQLPIEEQLRMRNGLEDLRSRNNDIKKLEESIIQLHQLFVDMQILVEAQGELLNEVEYNIVDTKEKAEAGYQELIEARAYQKSATRKKICVAFLVIAIIVAVSVPILIKYIPIWFPETAEAIESLPIIGGGSNSTDTTDETTGTDTGAESGSEGETSPSTETSTGTAAGSVATLIRTIPVDVAFVTMRRAGGHETVTKNHGGRGRVSLTHRGSSRQTKLNLEAADASMLILDAMEEDSGNVGRSLQNTELDSTSFRPELGSRGDYISSERAIDVLLEFVQNRIGREIAKLMGHEEDVWITVDKFEV